MPSGKSFIAALAIFSSACTVLTAQQSSTPTLNEILKRLEANLKQYDDGIPSFFCDEHVVSYVESNESKKNRITDSMFRLKRTVGADKTPSLEESRVINSVNGKPATSQNLAGPSVISGAFEGGLAIVSTNQATCMNYTLQRIDQKHPTNPYVIRFATIHSPQDVADCLLQERSQGRAFIDPASMQITHLEVTTPRHTIIPSESYLPPIVGKRVLTVDYAPVQLDEQTFWLPSQIISNAISDAGTFHPTVWSFVASYRNYHKLKVTTRIIPGGKVSVP